MNSAFRPEVQRFTHRQGMKLLGRALICAKSWIMCRRKHSLKGNEKGCGKYSSPAWLSESEYTLITFCIYKMGVEMAPLYLVILLSHVL